MNDTLSQLISEIRELEKMRLYYEIRILRKQIAMEEVMHGRERRMEEVGEAPPVIEMVEAILPELNGDPFGTAQVQAKCFDKFPSHKKKIQRGIHQACNRLVKLGKLTRSAEGMRNTSCV